MAKSAQAPAFKWPKTVSQELKQRQKQQGVARLEWVGRQKRKTYKVGEGGHDWWGNAEAADGGDEIV